MRDTVGSGSQPPARVGGRSVAQRETVDGTARLLVLAKARSILDAFTMQEPELSVAELTARTGLPASTCFRLVRNLAHDGLLERVGDKYRIGLSIVRWASSALASRNLVTLASPVLEWLRDTTEESAMLSVRDQDVAVLVAVANSLHPVVRQLHIGETAPLHAGSVGKVFLGFDPGSRELLVGDRFDALTPNTTTDRRRLMAEVEKIRLAGFAASSEERNLGAAGIAAPVWNERDMMVASIGLTGPIARLGSDFVERYAATVVEAASRLSRRLGSRKAID